MTQMIDHAVFARPGLTFGPPEVPHYRIKLARQINDQIRNFQN
jgi:hypothetical protein